MVNYEKQAKSIIRKTLKKHHIDCNGKDFSYYRNQPIRVESLGDQLISVTINTEEICEDLDVAMEAICDLVNAFEKVFEVDSRFMYDFLFVNLEPKAI